jgi:uncharacterized protein (DUF1330 family)
MHRSLGRYRRGVTVYAIAQLAIHDRESYDRYAAAFMPILTEHGGKLLAADEKPRLIEGDWAMSHGQPMNKVVLMEFPDRDTFLIWANSPEYQAISKDRQAGAATVTLMIRGLPQP